MPNCHVCGEATPVTQFYLLRIYQNKGGCIWYYACGIKCLKSLVRDKTLGWDHFLLREYMTSCGKAWEFDSREKLEDFVNSLD